MGAGVSRLPKVHSLPLNVLRLSSLHNRPLPKCDPEIKYNKQKETLLQL